MNITLLLGGASSERNVSLASGLRIAAALRAKGHRVTCLDPAGDVLSDDDERRIGGSAVGAAPPSVDELARLAGRMRPSFVERAEVRDADLVFLALHGGQGEDGTVQALLEMARVPYTGSGPMASAVAMDKDISKILFRAADVPTADWYMAPPALADAGAAEGPAFVRQCLRGIGLPLIVKPSKQGSTVGLTVVKQEAQLLPAIAEAFRHDDEVMVEKFVAGRELTVGVVGGLALPVGEIIPKHEIYDYECKYTAGMATEIFPADLAAPVAARCQLMAQRAFAALKLRGVARIDFRLDAAGEPWCLEANTLPGMTALSLIPQGAAAAGMSFEELCERIVSLALEGRDAGARTAGG